MNWINGCSLFLCLAALAGCPKPAPSPGKEASAAREAVRAKPGPRTVDLDISFEGFDKDLDWNDVVWRVTEACEAATRERVPPRSGDPAEAVRLLLRWNGPARKCRVSVGRVFCGYDRAGIDKARRLIGRELAAGKGSVEIDADGDVHARAWIAALRAVQAAGPARVYFTAGQPLDARPAFSTVRKYWLKDEKGTLVPDVTARVFVKPGTRFENIRNVMSFCVYVGIYKIYVGTSAETLVKAFLPVSAGN